MFDLSPIQIIIVLIIALVVFGPKRLPELGKQLGRGLRELKGQVTALSDEFRDDAQDTRHPAPAAATVEPDVATSEVMEDDDLLDGVVVSGASAPEPPRPTDAL